MSKERPGTGYCDLFQSQAQALYLEKKSTKLQRRHFDCKPKVQFRFFFFQNLHIHDVKNGQTVTLCSITPSESPQFKLSKPQNLQN